MAHRKQDEEKEDKEAAMTTWAMDYTFLTEDFEFLTKAEFEKYAHKEKVKDIVLVCDDRRSGGVKAHLVEHKGLLDTWISGRVAEDLAEFGYRGVGVCIKSDQEPAILEVQRKVAEIRSGAKTVPVNSPAEDSKSNGLVENAIRRVQVMIRTLRSSLQAKLGVKVGKGHALYPWLIEWAADLLTRYKVNSEGRTAVEEIRGKKSARSFAQFGEQIMYMPAQTAAGKLDKLDDRYRDGIFLGMRLRSDEILVGTAEGVVKARSVCRHPEGKQWDKDFAASVKGIPRQPVPGFDSDHVPATLGRRRDLEEGLVPQEAEIDPEEVVVVEETTVAPEEPMREMYVSKKLIDKHGYTEGCPGCKNLREGKRSVTHSNKCRDRIRAEMAKEEVGKEALEKEEARKERHFQAEVARQVAMDDRLFGEERRHEEEMDGVEQATGSSDRPTGKRKAAEELVQPTPEEREAGDAADADPEYRPATFLSLPNSYGNN